MAQPDDQHNQQAETLIALLVAAYLVGTSALMVVYGRIVREGIAGSIDFARILRRARRAAQAEIDHLDGVTQQTLPVIFTQVTTEAARRAHQEHAKATGINPMLAARNTEPIFVVHAETSAQAIRDDLAGRLDETRGNILRSADDLYRDVVQAAAQAQVLGKTPQEAIGQAFTDFTERGITAVTYRDGRKVPVESYVEMAVRTAAMRAYNISYEDRLQAIGVDYFTVPNDGRPCPLCWPWQHAILTATVPDHIASHTIEQARAAGLFHPQCKHVLMPYFPGRSAHPPANAPWTDEHQARYDETQRLRALERRVRGQKQARDLAVTPDARMAAVRRVRATEAAIRQHVALTDLNRRRHRETARTQ